MIGRPVIAIALGAVALSSAPAQGTKASCATAPANAAWVKAQREILAESPTRWTVDSLRTAMKSALGSAWSDSPDLQYGWAIVDSTPAAHDAAFTAMVATMKGLGRGSVAPSRTTVGVAGTRAMFVLSESDTTLLRAELHRMMEAGPDEGIKPDIALMEDRVRLMSGRKQLYGTQFHLAGGKLVPFAIEDSSHVDLRRETAMLPTIAWSLCNAKLHIAK